MDFQRRLLEVAKALRQEEVRAMVFLCTDLLGRNPAGVESAGDLFSLLSDQDYLSEERPHLLFELLSIIQRPRLLRELHLNCTGRSNLVSPYRKLLYCLSEELTTDDLKNIKFLLNNKLPRKKLDEVATLEVFMEMEHMDLISDTNLTLLENIIRSVCPVLVEKIHQFNAQNSVNHGLIAQEIGRPEVETNPLQPTEVPSFNRPTSVGEAEIIQPIEELTCFNTLPDMRRVLNDQDECEAGSPDLSGSRAETNSCAPVKVRSDALVTFTEENQTSSGAETRVTGNADADVEKYSMSATMRGRCLIINNCNFRVSSLKKRDGTMVDEASLRKVFKWLGFEVEIQRDCTAKSMLSLIQNLAKRSRREWDCVMCCVLSHGQEGCVYGVDGHTVKIKMLMEPFSGTDCPTLAGKPKLFFIQACQGVKQQGFVCTDGGESGYDFADTDAVQAKECIPSHADFLLGMATVPSFVSFRERTNGTWYIQSLCHNLIHMVPRGCDLMSILTKVNADVSKKTDDSGLKKQMPQPAFTLTKKIVFPAPKGPYPVL